MDILNLANGRGCITRKLHNSDICTIQATTLFAIELHYEKYICKKDL